MSLLTICQDAADGCGLAKPATIISNDNKEARQLFYYAKREGKDLLEDFPWQILVNPEGSITGDDAATAYALPTDFHRLVPETTWSRGENRQSYVPIGAKEWAYLKGWDIVTTLNRRARIYGGQMVFHKVLPSTVTIYFEYVSDLIWDIAATGTPKAVPTLDTDIFRLDEEIVTLGIIWRYKKARERAWKADFQEYLKKKQHMQAQEKSAAVLDAGVPRNRVWGIQVKDSGYGV